MTTLAQKGILKDQVCVLKKSRQNIQQLYCNPVIKHEFDSNPSTTQKLEPCCYSNNEYMHKIDNKGGFDPV